MTSDSPDLPAPPGHMASIGSDTKQIPRQREFLKHILGSITTLANGRENASVCHSPGPTSGS